MPGHNFSIIPQEVPKISTKYRKIQTKIPVPESIELLNKLDQYESVSMHGQLPIVWDRADDCIVYDSWGNSWIDFTSTIFVANAGHSNLRIRDVLINLLNKPLLNTYTYASHERAVYLEYLIKNTPKQFEKAFLVSAGTEATEACLKLMRLYGQKTGKRKLGIIAFEGNWHGRTMGAQMMSYNPSQKEWIGYLDPNIHHLAFPYPWRNEAMDDPAGFFTKNLENLLIEKNLDSSKDICGIMIETFQGWGAFFYPKQYIQAVVDFAHKNNILVAFDEMQAGFGRTGKLFGYMHYDVEPDLLALGKGASSGLPLSIVLGKKEIMDLPDVGSMSSTQSANPLVCAAGLANLQELLERKLIDNSENLGRIFHSELNKLKAKYDSYISMINGIGLIAGVIFTDKNRQPLTNLCDRIAELCMQKGLIVVHTGRESIKLGPPLSITENVLLEGLAVFDESINQAVQELMVK